MDKEPSLFSRMSPADWLLAALFTAVVTALVHLTFPPHGWLIGMLIALGLLYLASRRTAGSSACSSRWGCSTWPSAAGISCSRREGVISAAAFYTVQPCFRPPHDRSRRHDPAPRPWFHPLHAALTANRI